MYMTIFPSVHFFFNHYQSIFLKKIVLNSALYYALSNCGIRVPFPGRRYNYYFAAQHLPKIKIAIAWPRNVLQFQFTTQGYPFYTCSFLAHICYMIDYNYY